MTGKFLRIAILTALPLLSSTLLAKNDPAEADSTTTVEGELTVIHADDFVNHRFEHFFSVKDARSGQVYDIRFEDERVKRHPPARMRTGAKVRVNVELTGQTLTGHTLYASQIDDPGYYRDFFARVDKGIFIQKEKL